MASETLIPHSSKKRIVVIGGGFGGITLVKKLKNAGFQIVLLDKNNYHTFQPLLYQVATGGLEPDSIAYPLRKIFQGYKDFVFRVANVQSVDPGSNTIITDIGAIRYDMLVIATGSTNNFFGMKELAENAMPLKSLTEALDLRSLILQNLEKSLIAGDAKKKYLSIVIVGGGPTGVETAGALIELRNHVLPQDYPEIDFAQTHIYLVESGPKLLGVMSERASQKSLEFLERMGVTVLLNTQVKNYDGEKATLSNGNEIPTLSLIWSAGVQGQIISGFEKEKIARGNRVMVDRFNKVPGSENIYVIGDLAYMTEDKFPNGHPMVAQVAIQQAKNLAYNIKNRERSSGRLKPFSYKNLGVLATIGRNKAVADFPFIRLQGVFAWFLWMAVHLMTIVGFRNRIIVFINWVWNYFSYDRAIRLIIRPYRKKNL